MDKICNYLKELLSNENQSFYLNCCYVLFRLQFNLKISSVFSHLFYCKRLSNFHTDCPLRVRVVLKKHNDIKGNFKYPKEPLFLNERHLKSFNLDIFLS